MRLWYARPAKNWETEALPIGNGRLGGMIFGEMEKERIGFNENSLWTGDEKETGSYQPFGDLHVEWQHGPGQSYRRELDIGQALHRISYTAGGVVYRRESFCSFPDQVLVLRYAADPPGRYSGVLRLKDAHKAQVKAEGNRLAFSGKLDNGLAYEAQVLVLNDGGQVMAEGNVLHVREANSLTILLAAGTSYLNQSAHGWRGDPPHQRLLRQIDAAAGKKYEDLRSVHVRDYRGLFDRVQANLGRTDAQQAALPTEARLAAYRKGVRDPELEALLFQYGRYLLISCSRPGSLPANLQGLWNQSLDPPWRSDYHSNINVQMNYWPAETTALPECHEPFLAYIHSLRTGSHEGHPGPVSHNARLDRADGEQHLRRIGLAVESARQCLVCPASLGTLRLQWR